MGCLISNGVQRACDFSVGGIKRVILLNDSDVESLGYDTFGSITGATLVSGTTGYEFQAELNSASLTQALEAGQVSRFVTQTLVMGLAALNQQKVNTLNDLALSTLQGVVLANDGNWYWAGHLGSGLKSTALEVQTGAADSDDAMATVTLTGGNKGYAPVVNAAVIATLLAE